MRSDWWSCDGGGDLHHQCAATTSNDISRRSLLTRAALGTIAWLSSRESALSQIAIKPSRESDEVLVVIFMRGGADGLNVIVPYADENYYRLRPSLAIAPPKASQKDAALDLDGFFGLHPSMGPLRDLYESRSLAFVHAVGSFDQTRSHFDAMSAMERGLPQAGGNVSSGWLARHLESSTSSASSPLRAVAFGDVLPDSLRGASGAVSMTSLDEFRLQVPDRDRNHFEASLSAMYEMRQDEVGKAGVATLKAMQSLNRLDPVSYKADGGAVYPKSDLGNGLKQVALLIKSGVGLEVACLDKGGWDTHVAQGGTTGWQASLMLDLSESLRAFAQDLGPRMKNVTTVAMTEFGRRAYENSGLGTDHGRGSFMAVMGGGTTGGRVYAKWPGLAEGQLEGPGDLKVTTDYRNVLAEILQNRLANPNIVEVFPGIAYEPPKITA